jgi:hypothetical protein
MEILIPTSQSESFNYEISSSSGPRRYNCYEVNGVLWLRNSLATSRLLPLVGW